MSWSWSHTAEAYENARENLSRKSINDLIVILAEWRARGKDEETGEFTDDFNEEQYNVAKKTLEIDLKNKSLSKEDVADTIWALMEEQATCTNGGYEAHCCPFGCGSHMVSFSSFSEQMREAKRRKRK